MFRLIGIAVVYASCALAFAAEEQADPQDGHGAVAAESDPDHAADDHAADAHAAAGGGHVDHEPYVTALHGNAGPDLENPAEWKKSLSIWTLVVFGLLVSILWKFAWDPLREALDGREQAIQATIDAAQEQNAKATALLAEHQTRLAGTADEVRRILDEARRDAEAQKQGILAEAQAAAESEKNRALQEIDAAKNGALQELAERSVDTAVGLAGKIVQAQLSSDDHKSLISDAMQHFPSKN